MVLKLTFDDDQIRNDHDQSLCLPIAPVSLSLAASGRIEFFLIFHFALCQCWIYRLFLCLVTPGPQHFLPSNMFV